MSGPTKPDLADLELWAATFEWQHKLAEMAGVADAAASYARGVRFCKAWLEGMQRPKWMPADACQEGAYGLGERGG